MTRKILSTIIAGVVIIILSGVGYLATKPPKYIRGQFGTKCYIEGNEHGNIAIPLEFNSLEECQNDLN